MLENFGVPTALTTSFGEPIETGSLCIDRTDDNLYILKDIIGWVLVGSGSTSGTNGVIGDSRDGTYLDGIFPFIPSTPIGYAIDDINELLSALVPPPSPDLSDWTAILNGDVSGKLSFDTTNPIVGYENADSVMNPVSVDSSWNISGKRLGIHNLSGSINGVLNEQVSADSNGSYNANTFGNGDKGVINLILNNVLIDTIDLTSTNSSISSTNINVSATQDAMFPSGATFPDFKSRTGTWSLNLLHINVNKGYNNIIVEHDTGSVSIMLDKYEFIIDDNVSNTTFSSESLNNLSMSGSKYLSGILYHTGGQCKYDLNIDNMYRNTYYQNSDAITHQGNSNSYGVLLSSTQESLTPNGGNENQQVNILQKNAIITNIGIRIINSNISLNTTARRTVQGNSNTTLNQPNNTIGNILLDNVANSSTDISEQFNDENKRLISSLSYDNIGDVSLGVWNSQNWLLASGVNGAMLGYSDGLQVTEGKLVYPTSDFTTTTILNGSTFNDGGVLGGSRDYTTASGGRTYLRYFRQTSPTTANFIINIQGSGGSFVSKSTPLIGNNIHLEMKCPTQTGWMDCYDDFATGLFNDGDGARSATDGVGRTFNSNWGLTIGTQSTANSGGYMIIKIIVSDSFSGEFTDINFSFN